MNMKAPALNLVAIAAAAFALLFAPAYAQSPNDSTLLGKFNDWEAYTHGSGASKICFALSSPVEMAPRRANRGDVFVFVTHRPGRGVRNEISLRNGYLFSEKSRPYAEIGSDKFQMFTGVGQGGEGGHWAWLVDSSAEGQMVNAMKRGNSMVVKGTSSRGTLTTDRYSLRGITAAMNEIDKVCK